MLKNQSDDDSEEWQDLLASRTLQKTTDQVPVTAKNRTARSWQIMTGCLLVALTMFAIVIEKRPISSDKQSTNSNHHVELTCPPQVSHQQSENDINGTFEEMYMDSTQQIAANLTAYLDTFRNRKYDAWGKSYNSVKEGMHHWKSRRFPTNLKNGDTIYESACGIGLNLFMTAEILQENGLSDITVYGNEYVQESSDLSNRILDEMMPTVNSHKGSVCTGDSTDLHFVPNNAFDLVFTGYIAPMLDPLHLDIDTDESLSHYRKLCKAEQGDWKGKLLSAIAQQKQEDWYGSWVGEMVRIAKPGAPVIVEQVSAPYCKLVSGWGGVDRSFWKQAVAKYNWDVDVDSIESEADVLFTKRYHIFMRKNV
jgi:hypothetical protein